MKTRFLFVLAVGLLLAADKPKGDDKELKKFEGTWLPQAVEISGKKLSADDFKGAQLVIRGGKFTFKDPGGQTVEGTFKVDAATSPRSYDATTKASDGKTLTSYGIYEIKGDTLKVCYTTGKNTKRPREFKTKAGSQTALAVYQRKKD